MAGEKTEKATPKRKQDERKKGNVFQSREVVTVFSLIVSFYAFKFLAPMIVSFIEKSFVYYFSLSSQMDELTPMSVRELYIKGIIIFLVCVGPLLLISILVAIVITMAQTRMLVSFKSMAFKMNRLNPLQGIKKMFSLRGIVELIKSILKIVILGVIIYNNLKDQIFLMPRMIDMTVQQVMAMTGEVILSIVQSAAVIFVFVAMFDYVYQWWEYEKNMRMSKQEIKEEYKQTEGDPQVKSKIKERQQQQSRKRMMQSVPNADVVIRNPTHYAVALKYDPEKHNAPVLVAKGADHLALKIVRIAEENQVTVMENKPLARGLYEAVDLDMEIPDRFYQAVAEVLAFVYSLKKKDLKS